MWLVISFFSESNLTKVCLVKCKEVNLITKIQSRRGDWERVRRTWDIGIQFHKMLWWSLFLLHLTPLSPLMYSQLSLVQRPQLLWRLLPLIIGNFQLSLTVVSWCTNTIFWCNTVLFASRVKSYQYSSSSPYSSSPPPPPPPLLVLLVLGVTFKLRVQLYFLLVKKLRLSAGDQHLYPF